MYDMKSLDYLYYHPMNYINITKWIMHASEMYILL